MLSPGWSARADPAAVKDSKEAKLAGSLANKKRYDVEFQATIDQIKEEGRYRIFADLKRRRGNFPRTLYHADDGSTREVTVRVGVAWVVVVVSPSLELGVFAMCLAWPCLLVQFPSLPPCLLGGGYMIHGTPTPPPDFLLIGGIMSKSYRT